MSICFVSSPALPVSVSPPFLHATAPSCHSSLSSTFITPAAPSRTFLPTQAAPPLRVPPPRHEWAPERKDSGGRSATVRCKLRASERRISDRAGRRGRRQQAVSPANVSSSASSAAGSISNPAQFKTFSGSQSFRPGEMQQNTSWNTDPTLSFSVQLEKCPALVLNADFQPLSYMPLSLWPWQEAVKAVYSDRVNIVATYDVTVRSPSVIFPLPSVISLKHYQKKTHKPPFSRFNLFLRDSFSCQYCGTQLPTTELTFDHVVPRCLGGKTNWTNVVAACCTCNHRKGRRLLKDVPDLNLRKQPIEPTNISLQNAARLCPPRGTLHESWRDYIYWNESMEDEC